MTKTAFKVVPDTNILVAAIKSDHPNSPNKEFFAHWYKEEFALLYSNDTLLEYIEKLQDQNIPEATIKKFIRAILALGQRVIIIFLLIH